MALSSDTRLDQISKLLSRYDAIRLLDTEKQAKDQQEAEHKARISHQARTLAKHNDGYLRGGQTTKEIHWKRREEQTFRDISKRLGGLKHGKIKLKDNNSGCRPQGKTTSEGIR